MRVAAAIVGLALAAGIAFWYSRRYGPRGAVDRATGGYTGAIARGADGTYQVPAGYQARTDEYGQVVVGTTLIQGAEIRDDGTVAQRSDDDLGRNDAYNADGFLRLSVSEPDAAPITDSSGGGALYVPPPKTLASTVSVDTNVAGVQSFSIFKQ